MAMGKTNNTEFLNGLFEGGNFPNAQIIVMTGDGVHISYESPVRKAKGEPEPASKDAIMQSRGQVLIDFSKNQSKPVPVIASP